MKQKGITLLLIVIVVASIGIVAAYYLGSQKKSNSPVTGQTSPTVTTTSTKAAKKANSNGNTYTSEALGIEFDYASYLDAEKTVKTLIKEEGNKIYVYASTLQQPSQGQFIEVFSKDKSDDLTSAIEKKFLSGISKKDCFVEVRTNNTNPNMVEASISYPWSDKNEPKFMFGEKCPEDYKETNGVRYFEMDTNHPTTFIFLSIGQQPGPTSSDLPNSQEWFKSIRFLK